MAYPQNPVTVIKGDHVVKDVYLSDLAPWLTDGYEIEGRQKAIAPELAPEPKKKTKSTSTESE